MTSDPNTPAGSACSALQDFASGELTAQEHRSFAAHLPDCAPCQAGLEALIQFDLVTQEAAEARAATREQERRRRRIQEHRRILAGIMGFDLLPVVVGPSDDAQMDRRPHTQATGAGDIRDRQLLIFEQALARRIEEIRLLCDARSSAWRASKTQVLNLNAVIAASESMLGWQAGPNLHLDMRLDPEAPLIRANVVSVQRILLGMIMNAQAATGGRGTMVVTTHGLRGKSPQAPPGPYTMLQVRELKETTPDELALFGKTIELRVGTVGARHELGHYVEFEVYFPQAEDQDATPENKRLNIVPSERPAPPSGNVQVRAGDSPIEVALLQDQDDHQEYLRKQADTSKPSSGE